LNILEQMKEQAWLNKTRRSIIYLLRRETLREEINSVFTYSRSNVYNGNLRLILLSPIKVRLAN